MYIETELIEDHIKHGTYFKPACPNPLKKKVYKLVRTNGKYLNRDNWERGLYLVAEKYNMFGKDKILGRDRTFKTFFENYYRDPINFKDKILNEAGAEYVNYAAHEVIMRDSKDSEFIYNMTTMTVEEFTRLNPTGNYFLVVKCKIKNRCIQCIPVFDGRFLNNCNAHYWAVLEVYKLKDLN